MSLAARPRWLGSCMAAVLVAALGGCTAAAVAETATGGGGAGTTATQSTGVATPCDGKGEGEVCAPASCMNGQELGVGRCSATGACLPSSSRSCGFYACDAATALCWVRCDTTSQCAPGAFCDNAACQPGREPGDACRTQEECASRHCVDGVCCETACDGVCEACVAAKTASGKDGECGLVVGDTDPDEECTTDAPATCGRTGVCNGAGACTLYPLGEACLGNVCVDEVTIQAPSACNGAGVCTPGSTSTCPGNLRCQANACYTNCVGDSARCAPGFTCIYDGNDFVCIAV